MRIVNHKLVYDYCVQIIALVIIIIQLFHRFGKKKCIYHVYVLVSRLACKLLNCL